MQAGALNLNQLVALFLAEAIRSHRTSLSRAAEISGRVISKLQSITSESQALSVLKDVEQDFEEVSVLKQALHFGTKATDIKVYEPEIKDYASRNFSKDLHGCNAFLQDAAKQGTSIQELCLKYPDFCQFLIEHSDKAPLVSQI
jgi:hypothetical protein